MLLNKYNKCNICKKILPRVRDFGKEERKNERLSSREDGTLNFSPMNVLPPLSIYYIC
jgi:hypothetical protein